MGESAADDGERIAPVIYLFDRSPESAGISRAVPSPDFDVEDDGWPRDDACLRLEARDEALTALGRKGLSQRETERLLVRDLVPADVAASVVAELMREGYIDDSALAQELVGRLQERKGLGRSAIAAELTRRLLSPAAISYALELVDSGDELARAREVAAKRVAQFSGLDRETTVRRLSAYLQRRGYSGSAVRAAVESVVPLAGTASAAASTGTVRSR